MRRRGKDTRYKKSGEKRKGDEGESHASGRESCTSPGEKHTKKIIKIGNLQGAENKSAPDSTRRWWRLC